MDSFRHLSVMPGEVLEALRPKAGGVYLDGTLGGGGHSELILEQCGPDGRVIGIDRDSEAIAAASARLERFGARFTALKGGFGGLGSLLAEIGVTKIDGLLLDLGVSSHQLDKAERGFSFRNDGPLDMRMDQQSGESAADLVNTLPEKELYRIIAEYGEERWAKKIAAKIVQARQETRFTTTLQLADLVAGVIPRRFWEERIHPATRMFQGLRIAVNQELDQVKTGLQAGLELLVPGGRAAVISFHSLEDRIVKQLFREWAAGCVCPRGFPKCVCGNKPRLKVLTSRPIVAAEKEVAENPRSRSAKLRVAEKLGE